MTLAFKPMLAIAAVAALSAMPLAAQAQAQPAGCKMTAAGNCVVYKDLGQGAATADEVADGLFREETEPAQDREDRARCERLKADGIKCMPPVRTYVRYSLPGASFDIGSASLPDLMKQQLRTFATALKGRQSAKPEVLIEGHADATGNAEQNLLLSQRRAESVKAFLVELGVSPSLLQVKGEGAAQLRNAANPAAAENRRVEIARAGR